MYLNRRAFSRTILSTLLALLHFAFQVPAQEQSGATRSIRVLFVGNSYTYFNNLPEIFSRLADAGGQGRVEYRMEAPGGWRLKDHWEKGEALKALHDSRWDYVVLQEQSTSDPKAPQNLRIQFRGVCPKADHLRGIAEAAAENPESSIRLLGTWQLQRR